jgi:hypothetical protein
MNQTEPLKLFNPANCQLTGKRIVLKCFLDFIRLATVWKDNLLSESSIYFQFPFREKLSFISL